MTTAVIILLLFALSVYLLLKLDAVQDFIDFLLLDEPKKSDAVLKGEIGESAVNSYLNSLPSNEYTVYPNLYIPSPETEDRPHSEVDHIVVSRYGIFVIETKNHSGIIDAVEGRKYWKYQGRKGSLFSPILQNDGHIKDLAAFLGLGVEQFHSRIFFIAGNQFSRPLPPDVFTKNFREAITDKRETLLGGVQVERANTMLRNISDPAVQATAAREHTAHRLTKKAEADARRARARSSQRPTNPRFNA